MKIPATVLAALREAQHSDDSVFSGEIFPAVRISEGDEGLRRTIVGARRE